MGPIWGRQVPGGSHVGPMNFAIWVTVLGHQQAQCLMESQADFNQSSTQDQRFPVHTDKMIT